jgi:hypothetical protein
MKTKNITLTIITLIIITLSIISTVQGQPPDPPGHGLHGNQGAGGSAPIDGGSLMLILSGLGYGIIKVRMAFRRGK